jgi:hypothetical protein
MAGSALALSYGPTKRFLQKESKLPIDYEGVSLPLALALDRKSISSGLMHKIGWDRPTLKEIAKVLSKIESFAAKNTNSVN